MRFPVKKIAFAFIVLLLLISFTQSTVATQETSESSVRLLQVEDTSSRTGNVTNLSIEHLAGGIGISGTLQNNGKVALHNIMVAVNIINGSFVRLKTTPVSIPYLAVNASADFHVRLFGFGLGTFTPLPYLTITVTTAENIQREVHVGFKIVGPWTKIIALSFSDLVFNGYVLFSPEYSTKTFLMNRQGTIVHSWDAGYIQGLGVLLLENGDLLRTVLPFNNPVFIAGGVTGGVECFTWNGTRVWQYNYSSSLHCLHHGIDVLPNGHILMVGWEYKSGAEAIAAGRNPENLPVGELWPDHVIEVEPTGPTSGDIVWEWHVWDHLIQDFDSTKENFGVVRQHPELIDINCGDTEGKERADWNHINSIDYNAQYDQILLSARYQHEIWIIDHSTTTEEAAGHTGGRSGKGGDLLYRWGNPQTYQTGNLSDERLFAQHDAQWIPIGYPGEGHILVFNNGQGRPEGRFSSVDELIPPVDDNGTYYREPNSPFGPDEPMWSYTAENPLDFYAGYLSGAQRLPNGNTLICNGDQGFFFEVTLEKKTVWNYYNTIPTPFNNQVFKILCYPPDYPGLRNLYQ